MQAEVQLRDTELTTKVINTSDKVFTLKKCPAGAGFSNQGTPVNYGTSYRLAPKTTTKVGLSRFFLIFIPHISQRLALIILVMLTQSNV